MKIVVASNDSRHVASHAGHCRHWLLFEASAGSDSIEIARIDLTSDQIFHYYREENGPHPLTQAKVAIFQMSGEGFRNRLRQLGVEPVATAESDVRKAVSDYVENRLLPANPPGLMALVCKVHDFFSKHRR